MSYTAIGSVTDALARLLLAKLNKPPVLSGYVPRVTTLPPDDDRVSADSGINLFLYRVAENPHLSNQVWRGDRAQAGASRRPPLALTMSYMMTAYAKRNPGPVAQDDVTVHHLLGNAMSIFNEYPVLNDVHDADFDASTDQHFAPELRDAYEKVKIALLPTQLDDLAKIWTGLTKAYRLSVAYEVSLVQIAPQRSVAPAPAVQVPVLTVSPFARPIIAGLAPASGPVGTAVAVIGSGFTAPGQAPRVLVGDVEIGSADLVSITERELKFVMPSTIARGPDIGISVALGAAQSTPQIFRVDPWLASLSPVRGGTGVPVNMPTELPAGAVVSAEIGGESVSVIPGAGSVGVLVPDTATGNGPLPVTLIVDNGVAKRTNTLFYEVTPTIAKFVVTSVDVPPSTTIEVTGERLAGADVELRWGGLIARAEPVKPEEQDAAATTAVFRFPRIISDDPGRDLVVVVDGRASNSLPPRLMSAEPATAAAGDTISLIGTGLAGKAVTVEFDGQAVDLGPQAFARRFDLRIPVALAAGPVAVRAIVDGNRSMPLDFVVLP